MLGPLVISSASFLVPDDLLTSDMWRLLKNSVAKRRRLLAGRLLITDSKKAYSRKTGLGHLRKAVLTGLNCLKKHAESKEELLASLCPQCFERLGTYPWYQGLTEERLLANTDEIRIAGSVLEKNLAENDIQLIDLESRCLDVGHYNAMVASVQNKATVLFSAICSLIQRALENAPPGQNLQIIVDRQGGRMSYRRPLQRMFPEMQLTIITQDSATSSYELCGSGKTMRLHFVTKADSRFLPVSLASMTSKYIRELLVDSINRYFQKHRRTLKPTAGYWQDGQRFINDLQTHLPDLQYEKDKLIRSR